MLNNSDFWETEGDAPILNQNRGFFAADKEWKEAGARVSKWLDNAKVTDKDIEDVKVEFEAYKGHLVNDKVEPKRIFTKDAERTYRSKGNQGTLIEVLSFLEHKTGGYHQGLALSGGFLLLIADQVTVVALLLQFDKDPRFLPGVWKAEAVKMATDAFVFNSLLAQHYPDVHASMKEHGVGPEMYCQKYWCALGVHVLPFEALVCFLDRFTSEGFSYLFQLLLNLANILRGQLVAASDTSQLLSLLRLDRLKCPFITQELCLSVVDTEGKYNGLYDVQALPFSKLRKEAFDTHLSARLASANAAHAANDSDDDVKIPDCKVCEKQGEGEYWCKECDVDMCESCMDDNPPEGHDEDEHTVAHQTERNCIESDDEDEASEAIKNLKI